MNTFQTRLISLTLFAVFCATLYYWFVTLKSHPSPVPAAVVAAPARVSIQQVATLFGGQLRRTANQDVHLFGVLALSEGAAAIISMGAEPPHVVSLGRTIMSGAELAEVRPRSIIIDRNGSRSEVFLSNNVPGPTTYVR